MPPYRLLEQKHKKFVSISYALPKTLILEIKFDDNWRVEDVASPRLDVFYILPRVDAIVSHPIVPVPEI